MDRPAHYFHGLTVFLIGLAFAGTSLILFLTFLGILSIPGAAPDSIAALTNLVVLSVGMGLISTGVSLMLGLRSV